MGKTGICQGPTFMLSIWKAAGVEKCHRTRQTDAQSRHDLSPGICLLNTHDRAAAVPENDNLYLMPLCQLGRLGQLSQWPVF